MTRTILPGQYVKDITQPWRRGIFNSHNGTRATVLTHHRPRRRLFIRLDRLVRELKPKL